jgi:hypothetical protein
VTRAFLLLVVGIVSCSRASVAKPDASASDGWSDVAGAADFAQAGAQPVLLEVRQKPGTACGGDGCTAGIETRALGLLPVKYSSYFFPDSIRRPSARACPNAPDLASLFKQWTAIAIAPERESGGHHPSCGLSSDEDASTKSWVILRIGPTNEP